MVKHAFKKKRYSRRCIPEENGKGRKTLLVVRLDFHKVVSGVWKVGAYGAPIWIPFVVEFVDIDDEGSHG